MKVTATLLLVLLLIVCKAQTTDSAGVRLERYRQQYSQNLISLNQYQWLKAQLLDIPFDINAYPDSIRAQVLHHRYRSRIIGGSCLVGIGFSTAMVGAIVSGVVVPYQNEPFGPRQLSHPFVYTSVFGGFTAIIGAVFLGLGERDRRLYYNDYVALRLTGSNNSIGLACNF